MGPFVLHMQRTALTQMGHVMKMPSVRSSLDVITSLAHVRQCLWGMDSCANHVSIIPPEKYDRLRD